jgi:4-carboxymuconolactone decarboxylase
VNEARSERYLSGQAMRRQVLGSEHVDAAIANGHRFGTELQDLITEYCWGAIWGRPGLELKMRSLVNLGILAALNRPRELALHVRGAVQNGCTEQEIREVLLQTAVYCGVPAALDAFEVARRVLHEPGEDT